MSPSDALTAELAHLLAADPSVPSDVLRGGETIRLQTLFGLPDMTSFDSPAFRVYKRVWGADWTRLGKFEGKPVLEVAGPRHYVFTQKAAAPFAFVRASGERIEPGQMATDGGSIPRVVWCIPGFDPWSYLPAYLIHDWIFHCSRAANNLPCPWSFDVANTILAEAVYTMMVSGYGGMAEDWRRVAAVLAAVSSTFGRRAWGV